MPRLPLYSLRLVFGTGGLGLASPGLRLAVERPHGVDRLVEPLDQPLAFVVGEAESRTACETPITARARLHRAAPVILGFFFCETSPNFSCNLHGFLVSLGKFVDFPGELLQALLHDLVGDLFLIEE